MTLQRKIYISASIVVILAGLIIVFLIYPLFKGIQQNAIDLSSQKKELAALEAKFSNLVDLKNIYGDVDSNVSKIDTLLIDAEVPVQFIDFMEAAAKESDVKVRISPSSGLKEEDNGWRYVEFQIETSGSYPRLLKYVDKVENSPYLIEILNLSIVPSESGNVQSIFSINVFAK